MHTFNVSNDRQVEMTMVDCTIRMRLIGADGKTLFLDEIDFTSNECDTLLRDKSYWQELADRFAKYYDTAWTHSLRDGDKFIDVRLDIKKNVYTVNMTYGNGSEVVPAITGFLTAETAMLAGLMCLRDAAEQELAEIENIKKEHKL